MDGTVRREVQRLPRSSPERLFFLLCVVGLAAGLGAWILWLLVSVE